MKKKVFSCFFLNTIFACFNQLSSFPSSDYSTCALEIRIVIIIIVLTGFNYNECAALPKNRESIQQGTSQTKTIFSSSEEAKRTVTAMKAYELRLDVTI